jgi:hypothetical protein
MRKKLFVFALLLLVILGVAAFQQQNFPAVGLSTSTGGTTNTIPLFTGSSTIGNSPLTVSGTSISATAGDNIGFSASGGGSGLVDAGGGTVAVRSAANSTLYLQIGAGNYWANEGTTGNLIAGTDNAFSIGKTAANRPSSLYLGSAAITTGADGTLNNSGEVRRLVYKITVSGTTCVSANGFIAASLNADCVIATFPAKTEITRIVVDNTAGFTCSSVCSGTKTVQVGKTAGGTEFVVAKDATVIAQYGLANADLGAALTTSATTPVGGGDLPSWTTTTTIKARYVSGTGNWGNGSVTTVNAGSTTFYIETLVFP